MRKLKTTLMMFASLIFFSSSVSAVTAEGTIDEVRICGTGASSGWMELAYFKLSTDQWFVIHMNYVGNADGDASEQNGTYSLIMTAHNARYKVRVNATYPASDTFYTHCGVTPDAGLWNVIGDYVSIIEYSQ